MQSYSCPVAKLLRTDVLLTHHQPVGGLWFDGSGMRLGAAGSPSSSKKNLQSWIAGLRAMDTMRKVQIYSNWTVKRAINDPSGTQRLRNKHWIGQLKQRSGLGWRRPAPSHPSRSWTPCGQCWKMPSMGHRRCRALALVFTSYNAYPPFFHQQRNRLPIPAEAYRSARNPNNFQRVDTPAIQKNRATNGSPQTNKKNIYI